MVSFHDLPHELLLEIAYHLPWGDFHAFRTTGTTNYRLLTSDALKKYYAMNQDQMAMSMSLGNVLSYAPDDGFMQATRTLMRLGNISIRIPDKLNEDDLLPNDLTGFIRLRHLYHVCERLGDTATKFNTDDWLEILEPTKLQTELVDGVIMAALTELPQTSLSLLAAHIAHLTIRNHLAQEFFLVGAVDNLNDIMDVHALKHEFEDYARLRRVGPAEPGADLGTEEFARSGLWAATSNLVGLRLIATISEAATTSGVTLASMKNTFEELNGVWNMSKDMFLLTNGFEVERPDVAESSDDEFEPGENAVNAASSQSEVEGTAGEATNNDEFSEVSDTQTDDSS
ncbi:hypothetical protein BJ508DRAFT_168382 [Ascobolus immersus RN42]|uniref:F-box domain-containing protein n=1 Tax=Ascobolus immersus RN42 TaxID=1160509 RepID=A0A3N4II73_ASCIM|nr:hypothetical protein BJ508DRAFT_168382 [Ascobolus immersus RN42]